MILSEHFTLKEMIRSAKASELKINNTPSQKEIDNLKLLCEEVLEPLRKLIGKPIHVTSGYRCRELNNVVPFASKNSDHIDGNAADIFVNGMTVEEVFSVICVQSVFSYGQVICERLLGKNWVHISRVTKKHKMEKWLANKIVNKKVVYEKY